MPGVTEQEIAQAKQMNLYQYMQLCEPDNFKPEGPGQFRHKGHSSLTFAEDGSWTYFKTKATGRTALNYLIAVEGVSFVEAVREINRIQGGVRPSFQPVKAPPPPAEKKPAKEFKLPKPDKNNYAATAYLRKRCIHPNVLTVCKQKKILYQTSFKLRMTITNITARDNTVDVAVQIENAPDGVKSVQARIDNYGPYTQLIKNEGGIWSGSIDTGLYTPELVAGTHFVGVEAFDNENKKWTEYKDYSTPSDNPTIKWVFETGDSIQSSATINEANVYVGSNDGNLYCIDLDTGYQKWCIQTGDFVISKPAITSEGNIVFGSGDEFVYCASANDGNVIWNTKLGGSVLSDPLTSEGRVFIGCGDGKIYCLNSASGEIVWEYQTDGLMRQRPILENGILYAFVRDTYIWYAIDASTGQLIWRGNANTDESLFVCGDVRPVIANGKLWCIDAQNTRPAYLSLDTGELAWTSTLEKVSSRGMTTNGSTVFYSSNSGRQITAFDAETNQVVWQKDLRYDNKDRDLQEMQIDSALVYNGTSLIHVAERGRITALNPDNGEILWCIDAAGYPERVFWSTPEATDGLVIATGIDGKVYAVEYTH